jgi:hypothetical protein
MKYLMFILISFIMVSVVNATDYAVLGTGQSNMLPQGISADLEPEYRYLLSRPPGVHLYYWDQEVEYEGRDRFGPEIAIAHAWVRENPEDRLHIIICAKGGTSITDWLPLREPKTLYHDMRNAYRSITSKFNNVVLNQFIWIQGEKNCWLSLQIAIDYSQYLHSIINSVRRDLGTTETEVSVVVLSEPILHRPYTDLVIQGQRNISMIMNNVESIESDGIPKKDDLLHYSKPHLLGMRLVE